MGHDQTVLIFCTLGPNAECVYHVTTVAAVENYADIKWVRSVDGARQNILRARSFSDKDAAEQHAVYLTRTDRYARDIVRIYHNEVF